MGSRVIGWEVIAAMCTEVASFNTVVAVEIQRRGRGVFIQYRRPREGSREAEGLRREV